jgi:1-acyl-sn-glycerol-3-phosphate acyltransferase
VLIGLPYAKWAIAICVMFFAITGYLSSCYIPHAPPLGLASYIPGNWFTLTFRLLGKTQKNKTVFLIILGISWFWLLGASYLTQIPTYTKTVLFGDNTVVTLLLCMFTFGVAFGSLLCERLSGKKVEIGLVPFGALGLSIFGLDLWMVGDAFTPTPLRGFQEMLAHPASWRVVIDFFGMGVFGGFYIVPLYAMLQQQSDERDRAQMIAANNIMNAIFMVIAACLGVLTLGVANLSIPTFLGLLAVLNFLVAIYIFYRVPEFAMRFLVWALMHSFYRIRIEGVEKIPEHGAAVIVCNHVSYVDALILAGISSRPIRFVMFKPIYDIPILNFIFRTGKAIPIHSRYADSETFQRAFKEIAAALEAGDLLAIFPEGKITLDGEMNEFKKGIEQIINTTPVPVVPIALRGLWGSFFSRSGNGAFRKIPKKMGARIEAVIGDLIPPHQVSAEYLFQVVKNLRGDYR